MSRAAIYGAGSLGTILGAFITKNGGQIDLINHNQAHVKALNENGAKVVGTPSHEGVSARGNSIVSRGSG